MLKIMKICLDLAKNVSHPDCPIACAIVQKSCEIKSKLGNKNKNNTDKVIATAVNEAELRCDPTAHAEILCIQKACAILQRRNLSDCVLYCTLEPCPMCEEAINLARIPEVVFGAFRAERTGSCIAMVGGILEEECSLLLKDFFVSVRRNG